MSDSIKVAIKVRPLIKREKDDNLPLQWTVQGNSIIAVDQELRKRGDGGFYFDHIFDEDADNSTVFDTIVKPIVDAAVSGVNGTVFAYGQTSSGKTYTMMGASEESGVIPLAVEHIFDAISSTIGREFLLRVSYLEIYNEKVNDLLNKTGGDLKIHEDGSGQVIVKCKEELTNCPENVLSIMKKGNKNRRIGETNMNERSSRSHTIFRITIESREAGTDSDGAIQVSQLNLVDLAGSERARQTGATGERFKEGRHINLSLSTLGLVIMQLSDSQDNQKHVNFRDSKLTRLLQASLGGNAMTAIICAVTPAALDETQCTLSFASRAKSVKNKPQVNEVMTDTALLKRYARQISMLNAEMEKVKNEKQMSDGYNQLLEERLELLQNKIVPSDTGHQEESFRCKANRRRTWGGPTTFKPNLFPIFQPNTGLPTIKEMSPEKSHRKSVIQSVNIMNQTFQTAFADFEIELLESERDRETTNDGSDSEEEQFITKRDSGHHVQFRDPLSPVLSYCEVTPEKKSKEIQTVIKSPSTPKHVLRGIVSDLTEKYDALREYTTLEKQLICEENQCRQHAEDFKKYAELKNQIQTRVGTNETAFLQQLKEITGLNERYKDLDIKEDDTVEDIITKLCQKLTVVESQSRAEKDLMEQFQNRTKALEDQIQILVSERTNLCTELCAKTSELESINYKSLDEQLSKQTELAEVMQTKNQDLEAQCAEHRTTIEKIQSENKGLKEQIINQDDFLNDIQNKNKVLRQTIMGQEEVIRNLQDNKNSLETRFADQDKLLKDIKAKNNILEEQLEKQASVVNEVKDNNPANNEKHKEVEQHQEEYMEPDEADTIHFDEHFDNSDLNESSLDASKIIVDLEHEKDRLRTDLEMKNQELEGIKNDVQSLKLDIVNLDQTIQMLTNENMELHTILSEEKKRSAEAEFNSQKTMNDLYSNVSTLTNEKINLETELQIAKEQLQVFDLKASKISDEQDELLSIYPEQIEKLKSENIELIALIEEKNKELDKIKESKSLLFDHDCIYKDQITDLAERNTYLVTENDELSTDLMDKIEEIETLKTECETLKEKIKLSLANVENSGDNDIEHLRAENNILRAEVMELKMKVTTLADENATFSNNLLETMEDLSNSRRESLSNNTLHLSTVFSRSTQLNETANDIIEDGNREVLVDEVLKLRSEVAHLNRLNQKLSDLKLQTCSQCAHLQSLKENHRTLKVETKHIAHRFKDLQKKFDRKCEEVEALKIKANQDINLSQLEISLNGSFQDPLSVSFVEEKIEHLGNELRALKDANDHLVVAYKEKCEEFEHIQEEARSVGLNVESKTKNSSGKNEGRYDEIQKSIHRVALDIDDMKKDYNNWNTVLHRYKEERASLVEEIDVLKSMNEELSQKASEKELAAATFAEKAQVLEKEISTMMKEIEQYVSKEKETETERLTLEVTLEELKSDKENRDAIIEKLHKTIDELNVSLSSVKNELDLMNNQKCEILSSKDAIEHKYDNELQQLRKLCDELENEKKGRIKSQEDLLVREKELQLNLEKLTSELEEQKNVCSGHHEKICELGDLVKVANEMKEALEEKLNSAETKYKYELDLASQKLADTTKRSEDEVKAAKEALNKYVQENNSLTQELVRMRDIEEECNRNKNEAINRSSQEQELITDNKKLKDELNSARECIMKELKSLKHDENTMELLSKSINEIFIIFLQTLISKEEEMIKTLREQFEKGKQKLDDERRQCQDAEKRALSWVKELEAEIEKLQADLGKREGEHATYQENISKLDHLLRESNHDRDMLREKFESLETDYSNLQVEFEKQRQADAQQEEAILIAQKRDKELQEAFKNKEIELQTKLNAEKIMYESRIQDLTSVAEVYKTENLELKNNIENLETNEKQLKNIINANSAEIGKNNLQIERLNDQINELSKAYDEVNRIVEEKRLKINEISGLLKSKCDTVFEYKTKLDIIMPEYDLLKEQVNGRKVNIERYQEEIEALRIENDKQVKSLQSKLNSEEDKNSDLMKQSADLNNRNMALVGELDELKEKYELMQQENIKLERKMRKSTSKVKAEAEMDDLRDINKRLQNNLDGASNRITELQENKNQLLKKLENLKGEYNLLQQETTDLKRTVSSFKSKAHISSSKDDEKYDTILYEKNRIALEFEGLKLILNQKDKQIEKCKDEIDRLMQANKELDKELDEYAAVIQDLTDERASLQVKLHSYLNDNNVVSDLEEKVTKLLEENDRLKKEWEALKIQNEKLCNDAKSVYSLKKENTELLEKISEMEIKFDVKSNSSGSRCTSPAFESTRRRHSRSEIFNQRRHLENPASDAESNEAAERCQILRKKIRELELELVAKNGKIAALEVQIQSENFPYQRKCTELQEKLLAYTKMNAELKAQITKLQRVKDEINSWDCETCRRWRVNRRDQDCQTMPDNTMFPSSTIRFSNTSTGIVHDHFIVARLEKQNKLARELCRSRSRRIKELEDKLRELEDANNSSALRPLDVDKVTSNHQHGSVFPDRRQDFDKISKSVMKENIPVNVMGSRQFRHLDDSVGPKIDRSASSSFFNKI